MSDIKTRWNALCRCSYGVDGLYNEGEEDIAKDGHYSYHYAVSVIKGRFRIGEEMIRREAGNYWKCYVQFLKDRGIEI